MSVLTSQIRTTVTEKSSLPEVDFNNVPFGRVFSDHMLVAQFEDGAWKEPEIVPYGPLPFYPSLMALNYGQSIFEGMKAFRGIEGDVRMFRPRANFERMNKSAARMSMQQIPEHVFLDGLRALLELDKGWVPSEEQGSLYIRPLYFASDQFIGVHSSENYTFTIFTCPVGAYYSRPVNLIVNKDFVRAAPGGTGAAKAAGNYAGAMLPDKIAKSQGYDNVLWLDAKELTYVEECGTMNVFFIIDGTVITPNLSGTILPGINRASAIKLLKDNGYKVEERPISIHEIEAAYMDGKLEDCFGAGTAATISHVAKIGYAGRDMILPPVEDRTISNWIKETMHDIKTGAKSDPYGWIERV